MMTVYMCVHVCIGEGVSLYVDVVGCVCVSVFMCVCVSVSVFVCVFVCAYMTESVYVIIGYRKTKGYSPDLIRLPIKASLSLNRDEGSDRNGYFFYYISQSSKNHF